MLTDEQLEIISEALQPLFQNLEHEVIVDIARRIKKTMTYTRTAELQAMEMHRLGFSPARIRKEAMKLLRADAAYRKAVAKNTMEYKREVRKLINNITSAAYRANDEIVAGAGNMSWVDDLRVWKQAGKELGDSSYLSDLTGAFSAQTAGELKNLTRSTGFKSISGFESIENAYQNELDKAVMKICTGTFDQNKVVRDTVHSLAQSGLRSIDYSSGWSMQLDTAVRLSLRTGCHQLSGKIMDANIEQTGENLVYVTQHWGARNKGAGHANHEQWQGKVYYIRSGADYREETRRIGQDRIMDLWYATGYSADGAHENDPLGLYGYNCRHSHHVWFEGASSLPAYQPQPGPVTVGGKEYDYYAMTQRLRAMERGIRALKREKEALDSLKLDSTDIKTKIRTKTREYRDFCRACGVPEATTKLRYECGTSDLKKTQAWKRYADMRNETAAMDENSDPETIRRDLEQIRSELPEYTDRESRWSGKVIVDNAKCEEINASGVKEWNCDILLRSDADPGTRWHEMLHSCSASHYSPEDYYRCQKTEEAAVEYLTQEICSQRGIRHEGTYPNRVSVLRAVNSKMRFTETDLQFAKDFFAVEMPERYTWLQDKVSDYLMRSEASVEDAVEVMDFIAELEDLLP